MIDRFRGFLMSSSSFHLYLRTCNSFSYARWFARATSFINYSTILLNFTFAWQRQRTFYGVPYSIKLTFIYCKSFSFLVILFANFLFCKKVKRKGTVFRYSNTKIYWNLRHQIYIYTQYLLKTIGEFSWMSHNVSFCSFL